MIDTGEWTDCGKLVYLHHECYFCMTEHCPVCGASVNERKWVFDGGLGDRGLMRRTCLDCYLLKRFELREATT